MDKILYLQKIKIGSFLSLLAQEVYRRFGFGRTFGIIGSPKLGL